MPTHVRLRLVRPAALAKLVSVLHAKALDVVRLHVECSDVCLSVTGSAPDRLLPLLHRVVDVVDVAVTSTCTRRPAPRHLTTRSLVRRQAAIAVPAAHT